MYSLIDLAIHFFIRVGFAEDGPKFYERHRFIGALRKMRIPIVSYRSIEALVKKSA